MKATKVSAYSVYLGDNLTSRTMWKCGECGEDSIFFDFNFCPYCGAKVDEKE